MESKVIKNLLKKFSKRRKEMINFTKRIAYLKEKCEREIKNISHYRT